MNLSVFLAAFLLEERERKKKFFYLFTKKSINFEKL